LLGEEFYRAVELWVGTRFAILLSELDHLVGGDPFSV